MAFFDFYYNFQYAVIKDRKLGACYYAFILIFIIFYIIPIFINKRYLEYDDIMGTMRLGLGKNKKGEHLSNYCNHKRCENWDEYEAVYPHDLSNSIFVSTRVLDTYVNRLPNGTQIKIYQDDYYMNSFDSYYIKIRHNFMAPHFLEKNKSKKSNQFAKSNWEMDGTLYNEETNEIITHYPRGHKKDKISLTDLLKAAGLNLDDKMNYGNGDHLIRDKGCILFVWIEYSDKIDTVFSIKNENPYYNITVKYMPEADYKIIEPITFSNGTILKRKRFGVHIKLMQIGTMSKPSFEKAVTSAISILGVFTLAATVFEYLAVYLFQYKNEIYVEKVKQD